MQLQDIHFANLNAISHVGGLFSISSGQIWKLPESQFSQHKFYYILSGCCTIQIRGTEYEGIPGRCFFIPAGTSHSYANDMTRPYSKHWMHFDLLPRDINLFSALSLPYYIDVDVDGLFHKLFEEYSRIASSELLPDKLRVKALLFSLIAEYIRQAAEGEIRVANTENLESQRILHYIGEHIRDEFSNADMAALFHMEVRSFIRYFKRLTGYTPAKYITVRRLEMAKNLLEESELSVSDIMFQIGLQDLSHFSKLFKRYYSLSPKAYRNMVRRAGDSKN